MTERYVTHDAGGSGDGTVGSPWTFAEAAAAAVPGDRINIKTGAYSSSGITFTNFGTRQSLIIYRGYSSTIGDLDIQGRNSDSSLNTTDFPVFTLTGSIAPLEYTVFQNLRITGTATLGLIYGQYSDNVAILSCSLENTGTNVNDHCVSGDNNWTAINSDFECSSTTTHGNTWTTDKFSTLHSSRFITRGASGGGVYIDDGVVSGCTFIGVTTSVGLAFGTTAVQRAVMESTFYGLGVAIQTINSAAGDILLLVNNHVTDCSLYLNNQYEATEDHVAIEVHARTRDNTTDRTGFDDILIVGEVTTDTGGAGTDFIDYSNDDLQLTSLAAGFGKGVGIGLWNIGSFQNNASGSSGLTTAQAAQLTAIETRVLLALPSTAPSTSTGLPIGSDLIGTSSIVTAMEANGTKLDHIWETTEDDSGVRRFTANALEEAPSGTGGDATAANQATILANLAIVDGNVDDIETAVGALNDASASDVATAVFSFVLENSKTFAEFMRIIKAIISNNTTGDGKTFRDDANTKNRAVFTTDGSNNRTRSSEDGS